VFALASPQGELEWPAGMPQNFDANYPQRVVPVDTGQRTAMGPRYFQLLVDKRVGSRTITQFIGHIPRSKAAPHRHLYEEAIIVLAGEGCIWTERCKARVQAGEAIFLPRKQLHSLEATSHAGMFVVGVICQHCLLRLRLTAAWVPLTRARSGKAVCGAVLARGRS
jgi:mannose-6-phosphate isomerase-like protein (cupin superfamily)